MGMGFQIFTPLAGGARGQVLHSTSRSYAHPPGAHENGGEKQVLKISENRVQHGTTQNLVVYTDLPH